MLELGEIWEELGCCLEPSSVSSTGARSEEEDRDGELGSFLESSSVSSTGAESEEEDRDRELGRFLESSSVSSTGAGNRDLWAWSVETGDDESWELRCPPRTRAAWRRARSVEMGEESWEQYGARSMETGEGSWEQSGARSVETGEESWEQSGARSMETGEESWEPCRMEPGRSSGAASSWDGAWGVGRPRGAYSLEVESGSSPGAEEEREREGDGDEARVVGRGRALRERS